MINAVKEFFNEVNMIAEIMHAALMVQNFDSMGMF